jgi:predicted O-methyltransferase YrrM
MQSLADDHQVENICEIGFNAGYSALNFLSSNPTASIVSFDLLEHDYAYAAINALHSMYPSRNLVVIAGDSKIAVKDFHEMRPDFRCNLIFIGK